MVSTLLQPVSRLSSPTLRGFETNPFRLLRLPVSATTSEATFQAERILTLARAELQPEEADPLPWLPPPGIYEIQQAAQTIEEPLLRLTEQLLWFDFARDTSSAPLQETLHKLDWEMLRKHVNEESWLPEGDECDPTDARALPLIAQAINQANLRLLIAASMMSGVVSTQIAAPVKPQNIERGAWRKLDGLTVLPDTHKVLTELVDGGDSAPKAWAYWEGALRRWTRILASPWFRLYLSQCIADLGDDFVSTDDIETIEESIRARLADLSAKETRFLLLEGRYHLAGAMISAVSDSGLEMRVLGPALRPIHHLFQSEISELQSLLDESEEDGVEHIAAYLKRLEVIKWRWMALDKSGLIGLSHILDEAIEQAYLRLRRWSKPSPELDALLVKTADMATAKSLRERVNFYRKELEEAKSRVCYFCKTGEPDYDKSVVLEGKKVTGSEYKGNTHITYYGIRYGIVLRCARCARFHDYIGKVGILAVLAIGPGLVALLLPLVGANIEELFKAVFSLGILSVIIALFIGSALLAVFEQVPLGVKYAVALAITPSGHPRYGEYKDTDTYHSLKSEGYSVTAHWKSDTVSSLENKN
jgi:hypothetical protein